MSEWLLTGGGGVKQEAGSVAESTPDGDPLSTLQTPTSRSGHADTGEQCDDGWNPSN